jgi:hypothetical protein
MLLLGLRGSFTRLSGVFPHFTANPSALWLYQRNGMIVDGFLAKLAIIVAR